MNKFLFICRIFLYIIKLYAPIVNIILTVSGEYFNVLIAPTTENETVTPNLVGTGIHDCPLRNGFSSPFGVRFHEAVLTNASPLGEVAA
jgi:hypothetical protein